MKRITITIDRDEILEILAEHLEAMFPTLEIESVTGLGYGDVTARLRKPVEVIPAPPEVQPIQRPDDEGEFQETVDADAG